MKKELKEGMSIKLVKSINNFDCIGKEFTISKIENDFIYFKCNFGQGGIDKANLFNFFEIIEDEKENKQDNIDKSEIKINDNVKIIGGIFKESNLTGCVIDISDDKQFYNILLTDNNKINVHKNDVEKIIVNKVKINKAYKTTKSFGHREFICIVKIKK